MTKTKIDWADEVWNPTTGCRKVSEGCRNCYAERIANRFWRNGLAGNNYRPFSEVRCHPERLDQPLHWRKPRRVFVDSMSDLFHEDVPFKFVDCVFLMAESTPEHTYIILTKRPERMHEYFLYVDSTHLGNPNEHLDWAIVNLRKVLPNKSLGKYHEKMGKLQPGFSWPLPNVQLGVSVEDQKTADERIPWLLKTPAAVRMVSVEPMLGPVELNMKVKFIGGSEEVKDDHPDWVIAGCESGPNARPAELAWFRSLRDQCKNAEVPYFLKQMKVNGELVHMPELDGQVWAQYPGDA